MFFNFRQKNLKTIKKHLSLMPEILLKNTLVCQKQIQNKKKLYFNLTITLLLYILKNYFCYYFNTVNYQK